MNLASLLTATARRLPDKPALIVGRRVCTYAQLEAGSRRTAALLADAGVQPGRKIALSAPNGPEFVAAMMGILRAGAVAVPCASDAQAQERAAMIELVGCEYLLSLAAPGGGHDGSFRLFDDLDAVPLRLTPTPGLTAAPPDARLFDLGASNIRFTSGTTASFKGVVLTHECIRERTEAANRVLEISDRDTIYFGLQMAHHFAVSVMLHLSVGATIVTGGAFLGDSILRQIRQHRATVIYTTPVTYRFMADSPNASPDDVRTVRLAISTAMPLSPDIEAAFEQRFAMPLSQALGIIEVGMPIMNVPPTPGARGCLGRLLPDFDARIVDEEGTPVLPGAAGELYLRGPGMLAAYYSPWRTRDEILSNGWFRTGDVVCRDTNGAFHLVGRTKYVINVGGTKVFPLEIEQVLTAHPAVEEAVVTPTADPVLGEVPAATVQLRKGHTATSEALMAHCRQCLSQFKLPRTIRIVDALPRTHSGKPARANMA